MAETGKELKIGNFTGIITDYENENGEIALMYREPRGSITHPHRDETITLGTLMVEEYERPAGPSTSCSTSRRKARRRRSSRTAGWSGTTAR